MGVVILGLYCIVYRGAIIDFMVQVVLGKWFDRNSAAAAAFVLFYP